MSFFHPPRRALLSVLVCAALLFQCGAAAFAAEAAPLSSALSGETTAALPAADAKSVPPASTEAAAPSPDASAAPTPPLPATQSASQPDSPLPAPQSEAPAFLTTEGSPVQTPSPSAPPPTSALAAAPAEEDEAAPYRQTGRVYVFYREWDTGEPLAPTLTLSGYVGTAYHTTPPTINGFELYQTLGNPSGRFLPYDQYVTYYYAATAPACGTVTAKYLEKGTRLPLSSPMVYSGPVGSWYFTYEQTISGYDLVEISGSPSGVFLPSPQTVIYYYEKTPPAQGTVTVQYLLQGTDTALAPPEVLTGTVGSAYVTAPKELSGYLLSSAPDNAEGVYQAAPQTVTYFYLPLPPAQGTVTVRYLLQGGSAEVAPSETLTGALGAAYTASPKTVEGYTLSGDSGNTSGTYTAAPQTVTFYYTQNPPAQGSVFVQYLEQDTENEIADSELLTGIVGDAYTTAPKTIAGYTLSGNSGNTSGTYTAAAQTVRYYYTKDPPVQGVVTVRYLEQTSGAVLAPQTTLTGTVGTGYTAEEKTIPGYVLSSVEGAVEGSFTAAPQTVTFYYKPEPANLGTVTVKHLEKDTLMELAAADTLLGSVGDPYTALPKTLDGYLLAEISGSPEGSYQTTPQTVIYYYQKLPPATGSVLVRYLEQGSQTELAPSIALYGAVGSSYTTTAPEIAGYTPAADSGNTSGTYAAAPQTVTYYYTKLPPARGSVLVLFLDQKTKAPLAPQELLSGEVGTPYLTAAKMIKGYRMVLNSNNASGTYAENQQTVVYLYEKVTSVPDTGDSASAPLQGLLLLSALGVLFQARRLLKARSVSRKKR